MSMWTWMKGGETEDSKTVPNWTLAESLPLNMMCVPTETDGNWVDESGVSGMSQNGGEPGEGGSGVGELRTEVAVRRSIFPTPLSWFARRVEDLLVATFRTLYA